MKPRVKIAITKTPDGGEMELYQHDQDFSITVNGYFLMHSRQHESELELARLGLAHLINSTEPSILIGGLGMGYTLRQALDMLPPKALIVVVELLDAIVKWNNEFFINLNGMPLKDERVKLKRGNVIKLISRSKNTFDVILLDIDNGPNAITDSRNRYLYSHEGIKMCREALRKHGCLAVWSAEPSKKFERLLMNCGFNVRRFRVPAYKGSKSQGRFVWVASENVKILPPGGGEPLLPLKKKSTKTSQQPRYRRKKY